MKENRRFVRWVINKKADLRVSCESKTLACAVSDISYKGMKLHSCEELVKDTPVNLNLSIGEELNINVEAQVVWNKMLEGANACGLYFTRIKDADKEGIYEYVRKNFPEQMKNRFLGKDN
jgi:hypothetical protein